MTPAEIGALLACYWGKADPTVASPDADHHTVLGHSLDVAACAFVIVDRHPVLRQQLSRCSGIAEDKVALTFAAICALHDVGKIDTRFQRKAGNIADRLRHESAGIQRQSYDHGTEGFRQLEDDLATSELLRERLGPDSLSLLRAVCGHHGALPSTDEPDPSRCGLKATLRREDEIARTGFVNLVLAFFADLGAALPWSSAIGGPLIQRLAGICAISDWLGSGVEHFRYQPGLVDPATYWSRACEHATVACDRAGLLRTRLTSAGFGDLFPQFVPRDVQVLTESLELDTPALVIVEAEMGKGKTEAALSIAARFLNGGIADGITIALPTMATSNAMFARVEEVATRMFPNAEVQVALAHGRASREPRFQTLVERSLQARDPDATEATVMCARWLLNKKRILLAQIGVGTIDQALQAALVVRHQFVRMFGLSRNVVIIDEVHAYDAYMEVLLEHLLRWLGALKVPVVLLSATLPSARRTALARAWRGDDDAQSVPTEDLAAAKARSYPLVSIATSAGIDTLAMDALGTSRVLTVEHARHKDDAKDYLDEVARRLIDSARAGARVVWIRNTVREAQDAYRAVVAGARDVEHTLFHARFRGCDRSVIERAVLRQFGKTAPTGGRVLVATQVVEQSLDLDFDELHTDLAPLDLLFQRAGRLHRHTRARPAGFENPRLVVHSPSEADIAALRFGPSRYVYDAGTLWIANHLLSSRAELELPTDLRSLVEATYHPESRAALLPLGGPTLVAMEQARELELIGRRTKAKQCCIPPTTADPDGGGALDDDDDAVQAFTRDGLSATILPFWWDGAGARALYGHPDSPIWRLDSKASDAWRLASDLLDQTLSLPARRDVEAQPTESDDSWVGWRRAFARFADDASLGHRVVPLPLKREGEIYKGWLHMNGRRRRVLYTRELGLAMPTERGEAQQR